MAPMTFGEMLRISIAMPILLILSFLVLAPALERFLVYVRMRSFTGVWACATGLAGTLGRWPPRAGTRACSAPRWRHCWPLRR